MSITGRVHAEPPLYQETRASQSPFLPGRLLLVTEILWTGVIIWPMMQQLGRSALREVWNPERRIINRALVCD